MTITLQELSKKYDEYYIENPNKWDATPRDKYCYDVVSKYNWWNMIDVGCGNGHLLKFFADRTEGVKYAGVDMSPVACDLARKKAPESNIQLGVLGDVKFDKPFDLVVLLGVIEHLDMEDRAHTQSLAEIRNIMARDGILYIEAPACIAYENSIHEEGFRELASRSRQLEWHLWRETWEKIFTNAGFSIVESLKGPAQEWEFIWVLK